ncbi:cytochrome c oxidase assembly protein [Bradyrhizobium sp. USDA 10063]
MDRKGHHRLLAIALAGMGPPLFIAIEASPLATLGPLTGHMSRHILLMNVLAPLLALSMQAASRTASGVPSVQPIAVASIAQVAALWAAHAPAILNITMAVPAAHVLVQTFLFVTSLWFWWTLFAQSRQQLWRSIFALLITGKLFCLLGVLLVFAPRELYRSGFHSGVSHEGLSSLADQQVAGLLMLIACPLSYVLAATALAARWLRALAADGESSDPRPAGCNPG